MGDHLAEVEVGPGEVGGLTLVPGDLERLLEDVCDGEFEPDVQQVLEIQEQAGVGQAHQLSTQQFEAQFFM